MGIKELSEMLEAFKVCAIAVAKISKDGKIGASDLAHMLELSSKLDTLVEGFKGLDEAKKEAKDLDNAEIMALIGKLIEGVEDVEKARKEAK